MLLVPGFFDELNFLREFSLLQCYLVVRPRILFHYLYYSYVWVYVCISDH